MRPGDRGYHRVALDACVAELESAPAPITVERAWTLADGFCVIYRYDARPDVRYGYCARAVPAAEFGEPAEWGDSVGVEVWNGPPKDDELVYDANRIGWHGQVGPVPPAVPAG
jgi:hypothetical protein